MGGAAPRGLPPVILGPDPPLWLSLLIVFVAAPAVAVGAHVALHAVLGRLLRGEHAPVLRRVLSDGRLPVAVSLALLAMMAVLPAPASMSATRSGAWSTSSSTADRREAGSARGAGMEKLHSARRRPSRAFRPKSGRGTESKMVRKQGRRRVRR